MDDNINLADLVNQVHRGNNEGEHNNSEANPDDQEVVPTPLPKEAKKPLCRVMLSKENTARIDLIRISNEGYPSRPEMVNMIIEHYFDERVQNLSVNIQTIIDNL